MNTKFMPAQDSELEVYSDLRFFLDVLYDKYNRLDYLDTDPFSFVHRFSDPLEQEAIALIASQLAYGNAKQIRASIQNFLSLLGTRTRLKDWILNLDDPIVLKELREILSGFYHRFNRGEDLVVFMFLIHSSWRKWGSVAGQFASQESGSDPDNPNRIELTLSRVLTSWREWIPTQTKSRSINFLLSRPMDQSTCKRWMMFLRWMVREDDLDLGTWKKLSPGLKLSSKDLMIPLDTHVARISTYLGLRTRKSLDWKTVIQVTDHFKRINPQDPVKYDFSISRLGIMELCQKRFEKNICTKCELLPVCNLAKVKRF
jgi:uncharacterized protein (TIGR02757 family)